MTRYTFDFKIRCAFLRGSPLIADIIFVFMKIDRHSLLKIINDSVLRPYKFDNLNTSENLYTRVQYL